MDESATTTSRAHCWSVVRRIIDTFWPPLTPEDGASIEELRQLEQHLGLSLPRAMREWYEIVGHRTDILSDTDYRPHIDRLRVFNNMLIVRDVGDVVYAVAIHDLTTPDPSVFVDRDEHPPIWRLASPSFSAFVLALLAEDTCWRAAFTTNEQVSPGQAMTLKQHYDLLHSNVVSVELLGDADTLICLGNEAEADSSSVVVAMRTHAAASKFLQIVGSTGEVWHNGYSWSHPVTARCTDVPPLYRVVDSTPKSLRVLAMQSSCPAQHAED